MLLELLTSKAISYGTFLRTENERFFRAAKPNAHNSIDNLIMAGNFRTCSSVRELHLESSNYSSTTTYVGYTAAEVQFTKNTGYCIAAPRRNFEADSAAP